MRFASDNWAGAAPEIIDAIAAANGGATPAYGGDPVTARAADRLRTVFGVDCAAYFVATGSAANSLALATLCPPYGMIACHEAAHIQMDECGAPEFYTGGAKLLPIPGANGKLTPQGVTGALAGFPERPPHGMPAAALSITQGTECGTLYTSREIAALCEAAGALKVHMDGARFANAVAAGLDPADTTWRAGVDVLSFGATKNGCLAAEAVVFFNPEDAADFEFRRKRAGHLISKGRFIAAQFDAWLTDGLWLRLATDANRMAKRLSEGLAAIDGVEISYPTEINEVFVVFPEGVADALREAGAAFYPWVTPGDVAGGRMQRLITSFDTTADEIDAFVDKAETFAMRR